MKFPTFLGPLSPLPIAKHFAPGGLPTGGAGILNELPFAMQVQEEPNWCWAATTSSVSVFFDPNSQWTQCRVACICVGSQCCADCCGDPDVCNVPWRLDEPLLQTGNLQGSAQGGNVAMGVVQSEIDQGRPVCCWINWSGGRGHFVVISGYNSTRGELYVKDPLYGPHELQYSTFVSSYRGSGSWDYTYYTKP